jgi:release factor glutamine methyltransferase
MITVGEILQLTVQCFKEKGEGRRAAEELLAFVLKCDRLQLYMQFDKPLVEEELEKMRGVVKRKLKGEPLEYILGTVKFYGCTLQITPAVLIPRVETEILLEKVCARLKFRESDLGKTVWDMCTGSGALGIGLKKTLPIYTVTLADKSQEALELARENALLNHVEVAFIQGDLLTPFENQKTDIFLCNPPYVSLQEYQDLDASVKNYEPKDALVGGEDGLYFYKRLSRELPLYLNPGALVFLEIGACQGEAVRSLFSAPCWRRILIEKDWAGHDRFFSLEFV